MALALDTDRCRLSNLPCQESETVPVAEEWATRAVSELARLPWIGLETANGDVQPRSVRDRVVRTPKQSARCFAEVLREVFGLFADAGSVSPPNARRHWRGVTVVCDTAAPRQCARQAPATSSRTGAGRSPSTVSFRVTVGVTEVDTA